MDLWIRSQDRMELRPNPKLAIELIQDDYYITDRYDFDKSNVLGVYKTKERASEVLDEINRHIEELYNMTFTNDCDLSQFTYEMPKE